MCSVSTLCPGCMTIKGNTVGESSIYGSKDIPDLCEDCWQYEDNMIDEEGCNSPEYSDRIADILKKYRSNMKSPEFH